MISQFEQEIEKNYFKRFMTRKLMNDSIIFLSFQWSNSHWKIIHYVRTIGFFSLSYNFFVSLCERNFKQIYTYSLVNIMYNEKKNNFKFLQFSFSSYYDLFKWLSSKISFTIQNFSFLYNHEHSGGEFLTSVWRCFYMSGPYLMKGNCLNLFGSLTDFVHQIY